MYLGLKLRVFAATTLGLATYTNLANARDATSLDPLSTDISNCPTLDATPACALLTLSQCIWLRDPRLRNAIGAGDIIFYDGPWKDEDLRRLPDEYRGRLDGRHPPLYEVSDEPTVFGRLNEKGVPIVGEEYNEINEPERIVTVRLMDPREFGPADPAVRRGTHEVVLSYFEETSYIFRNDGNGWRIASIAGDGVTCVEVELVLWDYLWFCNRLIGLQH